MLLNKEMSWTPKMSHDVHEVFPDGQGLWYNYP